jgi:hypothetical protein
MHKEHGECEALWVGDGRLGMGGPILDRPLRRRLRRQDSSRHEGYKKKG